MRSAGEATARPIVATNSTCAVLHVGADRGIPGEGALGWRSRTPLYMQLREALPD